MCLVGFQKTNQNAIFSWGWPITWFPLGSNTKRRMYPLLFPPLIRTSEHFPVTWSVESMDMLLSVSSFLHRVGSFLFIVRLTVYVSFIADHHTFLEVDGRANRKEALSLISSVQPPKWGQRAPLCYGRK